MYLIQSHIGLFRITGLTSRLAILLRGHSGNFLKLAEEVRRVEISDRFGNRRHRFVRYEKQRFGGGNTLFGYKRYKRLSRFFMKQI